MSDNFGQEAVQEKFPEEGPEGVAGNEKNQGSGIPKGSPLGSSPDSYPHFQVGCVKRQTTVNGLFWFL